MCTLFLSYFFLGTLDLEINLEKQPHLITLDHTTNIFEASQDCGFS